MDVCISILTGYLGTKYFDKAILGTKVKTYCSIRIDILKFF
jgi:hypothetical protein